MAALTLTACAVGEDYRRPALEMPPAHRGADPSGTSLGARDWREVFTAPPLRALIDEALVANLDLAVAEARVREAQAGVAAARAGALPNVSLGLQTSPIARLPGETVSSSFLLAGLLSWEIDLWGRIRRATEAAQADLAASQAALEGARVSLVAQTASGWFTLAGLLDTRAATVRSAQLQRDSLKIMRRRNAAGIISAAEIRQAEGQLAGTEALLPEIERQVAATENALALLLARPPQGFAPAPASIELPAELPAGLPVELLERRPDLRQAEQVLVAANARVGEAKALLLPSLSITGTLGRVSTDLGQLLSGGSATMASLGPNVVAPLYTGGALQANRDVALARLDRALVAYRATALAALREVADAVETYRRAGEQFDRQRERASAQREALRLADKRFAAGVVSFLEVLDAQRQLLAAETDLVGAHQTRQVALVQVYRALGGGWSATAQPATPAVPGR